MFKDHIVTWVNEYLVIRHGENKAKEIIDDIDRRYDKFNDICRYVHSPLFARILAVPPFPGIQRFHEGRDFHQWTGDDSKALMKVSS